MSFSAIMSLIVTAFCVVLIAAAAISFFMWRPSAFETVTGFLQTVRHIPKDESVDIYKIQPKYDVCRAKPSLSAQIDSAAAKAVNQKSGEDHEHNVDLEH